ncbi:MAG: hypothetical protein ACFE9S_19120 [Candidatus Hermodarchaeota archaeon]
MTKWTEAKKAEVEKRILKVVNGFKYILQLKSNNAPEPVIKEINGKPCKVYPIKLILIKIVIDDQKIIDVNLKLDYSTYMTLLNTDTTEPKEYDIDLTPNLYNHLRSFIIKEKITNNDIFSLKRVGAEFWTKYNLLKVDKNATF